MEIKEEIKKYLDNRAKEDALFAERYAKEHKSIDECVEYVISCAYEKGAGKNIAVSRDEVFGWAVHYYDEDDVKIKKIGTSATTSKNVELTEEEKQELKKEAEAEYKERMIRKLMDDDKERRRKASEKKKEDRKESELLMNNLFKI